MRKRSSLDNTLRSTLSIQKIATTQDELKNKFGQSATNFKDVMQSPQFFPQKQYKFQQQKRLFQTNQHQTEDDGQAILYLNQQHGSFGINSDLNCQNISSFENRPTENIKVEGHEKKATETQKKRRARAKKRRQLSNNIPNVRAQREELSRSNETSE